MPSQEEREQIALMQFDLTHLSNFSLEDTDRLTPIQLRDQHQRLLDTLEAKIRAEAEAMRRSQRQMYGRG